MRPLLWAFIIAYGTATAAMGQAVRQASDWEKMYHDVSAQLQAAQNRKSQLAAENAKLTTQVSQLQSQLQYDQEERSRYPDPVFLQAFYAGWESFVVQNPNVLDQWGAYWGEGLPGIKDESSLLFEPHWPLRVP